ncbi:MAG: hypothetical protein WD040_09695, partial [Anaerolineales bacterium]
RAGPFTLADAVTLAELQAGFQDGSWETHVRPASDAIAALPRVEISPEGWTHIRNGNPITAHGGAEGLAAGIGPDGNLVAILEAQSDGQMWHPRKVFLS